jgi:hypothetical protein
MTAHLDRTDITANRDRAENRERIDTADPMDTTEATEPTDPIDRAEPTDPIDRTEPFEAMQRSESSDQRDQSEARCGFVIHPSIVERPALGRRAWVRVPDLAGRRPHGVPRACSRRRSRHGRLPETVTLRLSNARNGAIL